jgi:hypothetical protein
LRDSSRDGGRERSEAIETDRLGATREVRREEAKGSARDAIIGGEAMKENGVVNGVKGS